ncbi:MAG: VanZ family protein [Lachnospiraceae bacterium]|nr:VanZ family protein [Lachnospiraceae bacterium]
MVTMKNEKIRQILKCIPMVLVMVGIFVFSCMPGEESGNTSRGFLMTLAHIVEGITHKDFTTESIEAWHHFIRKGAHFTEYAVLGMTVVFAFWEKLKKAKKIIPVALGICAFYAATDEFHQHFVPNRVGSVSDVLLDSVGALTGTVIFLLLTAVKRKKMPE